MKKYILTLCIIALTTVTGCDKGAHSPRGFSLPEGDAVRGEKVFLDSGCLSCHTMKGYDRSEVDKDPKIAVALGGDVNRIKTYAELVTSVINPSHKLAKGYQEDVIQEQGVSKMPNYNDVLKVSQLIDLVMFLQSHYELKVYNRTHYPNIYP